LTIRAAMGRNPLIQFEESSAHYFHDRMVAIDSAGHDLQIEGIHFRWRVPLLARNGGSLIQLGQGSQLTMRNASLTIENPEQLEDVYAVGIASGTLRATRGTEPTVAETIIRWEDFVARGEMGLIQMEEPIGASVQLRGGLVAISESVLQVAGEPRGIGAPPRMQFSLERTTLHAKHLAEVWLEPGTRSIPRIERKGLESIFALQPNQGLIEYHHLNAGTLPATVPWFLDGSGNRYERPQDPLVRVSSAGDRRSEWTYGDALKYDWMKEAQTKTGVSWSGPWPIGKSLHEVEPYDFAQEDTAAGCVLDSLPTLPKSIVDELD
jgi:hypothetical protein